MRRQLPRRIALPRRLREHGEEQRKAIAPCCARALRLPASLPFPIAGLLHLQPLQRAPPDKRRLRILRQQALKAPRRSFVREWGFRTTALLRRQWLIFRWEGRDNEGRTSGGRDGWWDSYHRRAHASGGTLGSGPASDMDQAPGVPGEAAETRIKDHE